MNKTVYFYSSLIAILIVGTANAQLPANPWDAAGFEQAISSGQNQDAGGVAKISAPATNENELPPVKYAPVNADAETPQYVPAIDEHGNAKTGVTVKSISSPASNTQKKATTSGTSVALQQNIQNNGTSWRGSGQFGKLNYTGEVTTYDTAQGQEMLAPEVNQHNIKVMLDHLRNLGYKIPESYNDKYSNFLSDYKRELQNAYSGLGHQNNPFDTMFSGLLDVFEEGTGLDIENLLFNSLDLLSKE